MTNKNLYILIGLPGSGKTTYLKNKDGFVFSSDEIRKELFGDESIQKNPHLVFSILEKKVEEELEKGTANNVYIDATSLSKKSRNFYTHGFKGKMKKRGINLKLIALDFKISIEKCIERDSLRERTVGKNIISNMAMRYCIPDNEGFDQVIKIVDKDKNTIDMSFNKNTSKFLLSIINLCYELKHYKDEVNISTVKEMISEHFVKTKKSYLFGQINIEQSSKYHQEPLILHLAFILTEIMLEYMHNKITITDLRLLTLATLYHDIGKIYTGKTRAQNQNIQGYIQDENDKTIFRKKDKFKTIEKYNDIQFIGHEKISGYIFENDIEKNLTGILTESESRTLCSIIYNHLRYHQINRGKEKPFDDNKENNRLGLLFSKFDSLGRVIRR